MRATFKMWDGFEKLLDPENTGLNFVGKCITFDMQLVASQPTRSTQEVTMNDVMCTFVKFLFVRIHISKLR